MSVAAARTSEGRYDGVDAAVLAARWRRPLVVAMARTTSTMDVAHELAADGALAGSVVLADEQTAGRGRAGKRWTSAPGQGVWVTTIERPRDAGALEVLSLRIGLAAARALEPLAGRAIGIKWPNDLLVGGAKLGGILVEARWREGSPEWVAIGIGINARPAPGISAAALRDDVTRLEVLDALLPAVASAAAASGHLSDAEMAAIEPRDVARTRLATAPAAGRIEGISRTGELLVRGDDGVVRGCRSGSLIFREDA